VPEISIVIVGDIRRGEFRRVRETLDGFGPLACFAAIEPAIAALRSGQVAADVIVVAQAYPGQFSAAQMDCLRQAAPVTRVVALLGSCCEGEMRTGKPWPADVRVYWHQWPARAQQELRLLLAGRASTWSLPATASEEERLLAAADRPLPQRQGLVAIHTPSAAMENWLSAACRSCWLSTVWLRPAQPAPVRGALAAIFDGSECRGEERDELRRTAAMLAPAPVVALLDFPRIEDHERALAAGAAAVVSKPLHVEDLFWQLDAVTIV
jgi:DNA-binding NarL/FixJ family response regulator